MAEKAIFEYWNCGLAVSGTLRHIHLTQEDAERCEAKQEIARKRQVLSDIRKAKIEEKRQKERIAKIEIERKLASTANDNFSGMKKDGIALAINRGVFTVDDLESAVKQGVFQDYHVGFKSLMEWFYGR